MDDRTLVGALQEPVAALLERHLSMTKEWFPHELVPWSLGRDFEAGAAWDPGEFPVPQAVRSALYVNILTEDNLPFYFHAVSRVFSADGPWGEWARRWTAEEHRHSIVIRDWLTVTRALDPVELERSRMAQVSSGFPYLNKINGACEGLVYVTMQELATRISHRNTGRMLDDPFGSDIMSRVANDENLHFLFYRDLASAALALDPSAMVLAIAAQVRRFEMPGTEINDFAAHTDAIAGAGIYDMAIHHDQILVPVVLRHWRLESIEGLSPEAEQARASTLRRIHRLGRVGRRLVDRREELAAAGQS
jgi:acyl-[acyl-carrier-protein] desaturase